MSLADLVADRQNERLIKLHFPNNDGPASPLLVNHMAVSEAVSRDFEIKLELLCDDFLLQQKDLMGRMITVELECSDGQPRYFNGYIFEFRLAQADGGFAFYDLVARPWTHFLSLRKDNYLFQGKTLQDALQEIFADYGTLPKVSFRLQSTPATETFRCQWDETDYNYLHRRLEEKGWWYCFEHEADGHTLVISDDSTLAQPIDRSPTIRFHSDHGAAQDDVIHTWSPERQIMPGTVNVSSWDFKNPRPLLTETQTINEQGDVRHYDVYEYAGSYGFQDMGAGQRLAKLRMEEIESQAKHFLGSGNCRLLQAGRTFELVDHFDHDQDDSSERQFFVLEVKHTGNNNYLSGTGSVTYFNELAAARKHVPFRPGKGYHSVEPKLHGMQTAVVVGPPGEVIHCDEYGRIKVQFHWDREGKNDDKSSCWVRVASMWAGSNFGAISLPRVGQEVIVQWLDSNPDLPIVTGSVYNAANMPPWDLPANKTQSGILTRSPNGSPANANALRFEDLKGKEEVWLHAEKDQRIEVEHDESHWVGHDRVKNIDNDETVHVKHDRTETVDNDETITIHGNRKERVDHNETISIGDNRSEDVGGNETLDVKGNRSETIHGMESLKVLMASNEFVALAKALEVILGYSINVGGAMNVLVGLAAMEQVGLNKSVNVGKKFSITAGDELEITVGKSTLVMKSDGSITINGSTFDFSASGHVLIAGHDVDINQ